MPRTWLPDEHPVLPTMHKHWIILVRPFVIPALIALVVAAVVNLVSAGPVNGGPRTLITLLLVGGAALWAVFAWLVRISSSLTVTNQRVIQEEGVLRRRSNVIPVDRIQDITIKQTVTGRVLGYGDIEIDTAGVVANETFTYLSDPEQNRDQLFVVSARWRRPSGAEAPAGADDDI